MLPILTTQMEQLQIPGLVAMVQASNGDTYQAALGVANVSTGEPMEMDDRFRIGSITKTMTATVILQLSDEGKLSLDDPLETYLPGYSTNDATIQQALDMRSGIPSYTDETFWQGLAADPERVWTPQEVLDTVADRSATFLAGERERILEYQLPDAGLDRRAGRRSASRRAPSGPHIHPAGYGQLHSRPGRYDHPEPPLTRLSVGCLLGWRRISPAAPRRDRLEYVGCIRRWGGDL